MSKTVELKHVGFYCQGNANLNLWDGSNGTISMFPWESVSDKREDVVQGVNDRQFGCESISSAVVEVYNLYEKGHREYKETIKFSAKELKEAKRGI